MDLKQGIVTALAWLFAEMYSSVQPIEIILHEYEESLDHTKEE